MAETVLLLYMREETYGKRMLRFLLGKKNPYIHPELVTAKEKAIQRIGTENQHVTILTDCEEILENEDKNIVFLSSAIRKGVPTIFQFQKAEEIYEELLIYLGIQKEETPGCKFVKQRQKKGVLFLLSPDAVGVTAIATLISQYLGRQGKCLYIALSDFPVWYGETLSECPDFHQEGTEELLFMSSREDFAEREKEIRKEVGTAYLLPPFHHYKDLLDSTKEDWAELFERLLTESGYDNIVVELGAMMEQTLEILSLGDEIILLSQSGLLGGIRRNVWKQYCRMERKEDVLDKIKWLLVPEEWQEWENMITEQPLQELAENNQLMAKVGAILNTDRGEQDVCILEDIG